MNSCNLDYIPNHLHWGNKPLIPVFSVDELLFYRATEKTIQSPYSAITLSDISMNRSGVETHILSSPEDVRWCINPDEGIQKYDCKVIILSIKKISEGAPAKKEIIYEDENTGDKTSCLLSLEHEPLPCNYPHSVIAFYINDIKVTYVNYNETLGQKSKAYKNLRKCCRDELHKAIISREINFAEN